MNNTQKQERKYRNIFSGVAIGTGLFFGGLFLSIWSLGLAAPLGILLMLGGLALPFWEARMASRGRSWIGRRKENGSAFLSREESAELRRDRSRERRQRQNELAAGV